MNRWRDRTSATRDRTSATVVGWIVEPRREPVLVPTRHRSIIAELGDHSTPAIDISIYQIHSDQCTDLAI